MRSIQSSPSVHLRSPPASSSTRCCRRRQTKIRRRNSRRDGSAWTRKLSCIFVTSRDRVELDCCCIASWNMYFFGYFVVEHLSLDSDALSALPLQTERREMLRTLHPKGNDFDIRFSRLSFVLAWIPLKFRFASFLLVFHTPRHRHLTSTQAHRTEDVVQSLRPVSATTRGGQFHGGRRDVPSGAHAVSVSARDLDPVDPRIAVDSIDKGEGERTDNFSRFPIK